MTRATNHVEIEMALDASEEATVVKMSSMRPADWDQSLTDVENSARLIRLHGDRLRNVSEWGTWIVWDGAKWLTDRHRVAVFQLAKDVSADLFIEAAANPAFANSISGWAKRSATRTQIAAMVELARGIHGVPINAADLDADPWLLGVANGYINLRDGTFHKPDPDKLMTMQAPVTYDPDAEAPRWDQALAEWFPDPEVRDYVQRLSGHALAGDPLGDHIFVIHFGDGRNGKGTFMRGHKHVLGDYYVTPDKSLLIRTRHEQHATVKASLFRKRLAVSSETEQHQRLNEAQVKNYTGRDPINARRIREDEWEFEPTHSLWLQTNSLPEISGSDHGIWSRIKVVPWTETFDSQGDPNLDTTLAAEAAGILNWMIEGCLRWQNEGLDEPEAVTAATLDYRATEDVLTKFATETGLQFARGLTVIDADLKKRLAEWTAGELIEPPGAKQTNSWMKANGCRDTRQNQPQQDGKTAKRKTWHGAGFTRPTGHDPETPETLATTR